MIQKVENTPDEKIMQNVRDGNIAEMSVLFERYHLRLYNFFLKMGLQKDISQDLTQNLFYRIIKYRRTYRAGYSLKSWIYQMARNLHADYRKQQEVVDDTDRYREEDYERLDYALTLLGDEQRELIVLSRYQGLKYEEISTIVNQSVPAIKVAIHRAIKQLRSIYFKQI